MRVDNKDDRMEMPEECDTCGYPTELVRYSHYGPGLQVSWTCKYCANDFTHGESDVVKSIAAMLNELEKVLVR